MRATSLLRCGPPLLLPLVLSLGAAGCGGSPSPSTEPPPSTPPPTDSPTANHPPSVQQVAASQTSLDEGSSLTLSVNASDPDGQPLTYSWTQLPPSPPGLFGPDTGGSRTWTAPLLSRTTVFTLKVTASDGKGGTAQGSVNVTVANVPALNQAPIVDEAPTLPTTRVIAGDSVPLFIGARDQDGDPLSFSWKVLPGSATGTLSDGQTNMASWRSPDLAAATSYTFQVTVSDGTATVTRSASLRVDMPTYAQDIQPLWSPACTDCHNDSPGSFGNLNLLPGASWAQLVHHATAGACSALQRVTPGQPDDSLLVMRVSGESCGRQMPQSDSDYFNRNPGQLTRLRSWILAGAPDN